MVMLAVIVVMRVLGLSSSLVALARARSAVVRLAIRIVRARAIARGLVAGLSDFAGRMVNATH